VEAGTTFTISEEKRREEKRRGVLVDFPLFTRNPFQLITHLNNLKILSTLINLLAFVMLVLLPFCAKLK